MGANAQTTVPTYVAAQVLTAEQLNQSARTGVPVFSSTGNRDAAFGGSGEKTLAEGQFCYVEGTGFQTYNGTAWVTWGTSPSGGLDLVKTQTIGTGVSSVTVNDAFSSTYDNYKIFISGGSASTNTNLNLQLGASSTSYYGTLIYGTYNVANVLIINDNNTGIFRYVGTVGNNICINVDLVNPGRAARTFISSTYADVFSTGAGGRYQGFHDVATAYTSFTLQPNGGTLTGGDIKVYGYKN